MQGRRTQALVQAVVLGLTMIVFFSRAAAQISAGGTPISFGTPIAGVVPTTTMPSVDVAALLAEDALASENDPYRFAEGIDVHLNLNNSGTWVVLPNGDRLWRLRIQSEGAQTLGLIYDEWNLPKGARLFLYNDDHSHVIGAFTSSNNWRDGTNTTAPVRGDAITLELVEPSGKRGESVLSVSRVCHAYRGASGFHSRDPLDAYGASDTCMINVACPLGDDWQNEANSIAKIYVAGTHLCTGALIRTADGAFHPYILTANHCFKPGMASSVFEFDYRSVTCAGQQPPASTHVIANCVVNARWRQSDFMLLEMSSLPPVNWTPYFAGWDRRDVIPPNTTGLHHPQGDVMKISFDNDSPVGPNPFDTTYVPEGPDQYMWRVVDWDNGSTQGGSSGSPLFDANHRIIGQLYGGAATCANNLYDRYGRLARSWWGGDSFDSSLVSWLDLNATDTLFINGAYLNSPANDLCPGIEISSIPFSHSSSTALASRDYDNFIEGVGPEVIYRLSLDPGFYENHQPLRVSVCTADFDAAVEVRDGCECGTLVAWDDDLCGPNAGARCDFVAWYAQTYYIRVYGAGTASGNYTLSVTALAPPVSYGGDNCGDITTLPETPFLRQGTTLGYADDFTLCSIGYEEPDAVHRFQPDTNGFYVGRYASLFYSCLVVRQSNACPGGSDWFHPGYNGQTFAVSYAPNPPTRIWIDSNEESATDQGNYYLEMRHVDSCITGPRASCIAAPMATAPFAASGTYFCEHPLKNLNPIWYPFVLEQVCDLEILLCTDAVCGYDCILGADVYSTCPAGEFPLPADEYDYAPQECDVAGMKQTYYALPAGTYYIAVYDWLSCGNEIQYVLNVECPPGARPANDRCEQAAPVSLPANLTGTTVGSTKDCSYLPGGAETWHAFTVPVSSDVTLNFCGTSPAFSTVNTVLVQNCPCDPTLIQASSLEQCGDGNYTMTWVDLAAGTYYYPVRHEANLADGPYTINATAFPHTPPNDVGPGVLVQSIPFYYAGSTSGAHSEEYTGCDDQESPTVYFTLNFPECRDVVVDLCGSSFDTRLDLRTGGSFPGDSLLACGQNETCPEDSFPHAMISFQALPNTNYYLVVHGEDGASGQYQMTIEGAVCGGGLGTPDSLVIRRNGDHIRLNWSSAAGAVHYNVYRSSNSGVAIIPANLIGTSNTTFYTDSSAVLNPAAARFYAVTAE